MKKKAEGAGTARPFLGGKTVLHPKLGLLRDMVLDSARHFV